MLMHSNEVGGILSVVNNDSCKNVIRREILVRIDTSIDR
jgi:hypothetical protein